MSQAELNGFERILEFLRQARGFDFTAYKRTSLMRRVRKRMEAAGIEELDPYLDYLQVHPEEFSALFNTVLINVTSFFRDPEVWEVLRERVVPDLAGVRADEGPIRVWSAGSASGEEAYSVAMLLAETIGIDAFRERVKIYATDVDDEALGEARRAVYTARQIADVPAPLVEKYFTRDGGQLYTFDRNLRRSVIFGRHDLIQDAPISRVDLLLCRNTLMYFNAEAQGRIMARFYFSVNPGGHLVLGLAEMLFSHASMFNPVDLKRRIFKTAPRANGMRISYSDVTPMKSLQEELTHSRQELETADEERQSTNEEPEATKEELQSTIEELETMNEELQSTNEELQTINDELRNRSTELNSSNAFLEAVFTSLRAAVVVIDREMRVQVWNAGALDMWGLRPEEAERSSFFNLDIGLPVGELHQLIGDILSGGATHREAVIAATDNKGRPIECRVSIAPLVGGDRTVTGAILLIEDGSPQG